MAPLSLILAVLAVLIEPLTFLSWECLFSLRGQLVSPREGCLISFKGDAYFPTGIHILQF